MIPEFLRDEDGRRPEAWYRAFDRAMHYGELETAEELLLQMRLQLPHIKERIARGGSGTHVDIEMLWDEAHEHGLRQSNEGKWYIPKGHSSWTPDMVTSISEEERLAAIKDEELERKIAAGELSYGRALAHLMALDMPVAEADRRVGILNKKLRDDAVEDHRRRHPKPEQEPSTAPGEQ